jgi:hypothetical protein
MAVQHSVEGPGGAFGVGGAFEQELGGRRAGDRDQVLDLTCVGDGGGLYGS